MSTGSQSNLDGPPEEENGNRTGWSAACTFNIEVHDYASVSLLPCDVTNEIDNRIARRMNLRERSCATPRRRNRDHFDVAGISHGRLRVSSTLSRLSWKLTLLVS